MEKCRFPNIGSFIRSFDIPFKEQIYALNVLIICCWRMDAVVNERVSTHHYVDVELWAKDHWQIIIESAR